MHARQGKKEHSYHGLKIPQIVPFMGVKEERFEKLNPMAE